MQFKLFGLSIDVPDTLVEMLSSKKHLIWVGPGEPPRAIAKKNSLGETVFVRDEFMLLNKLPRTEEDTDEKVIVNYLKTGAALTIGWVRPDNKDRREVFIDLTSYLLIPWLTKLGERVQDNFKTALPMYKATILDYLAEPEVLQPSELFEWVLTNGAINHNRTDAIATLGAAWLHYAMNGPFTGIQSVVSWSKQEFEEDDDGEIVLSSARTSAWLFTAPTPIGYRSPLGEARARARIASGQIIPYAEDLVSIDATPNPKLWIDFQAYLAAGIPAIIEQKSRWLCVGGAIVDGKYYSITGGKKLTKVLARPFMDAGDEATINPMYHQLSDDFLKLMLHNGESYTIQRGIKIMCAIGNFRGYACSGATPIRDMTFHLKSERTIKSQVTVDQFTQLNLQSTIGKTIAPWTSVIGVHRVLVNDTGQPVIIDKVTSTPDKDKKFVIVKASCHIPVTSTTVKLRGPAKLQTFDTSFLPVEYQFDWSSFGPSVKLLVGAEENKVPAMTMRRAWAIETQTHCVIDEAGNWDHEDEFVEWYRNKLKKATLRIPVGHSVADVLRQSGSVVEEHDGVEYLVDEFEWIEAELVFGVESMPASIRWTTTSITPSMHLNFSMKNRCVRSFHATKTLKQTLYNKDWKRTKASELKPLIAQPWARFLHLAGKKWKDGSMIRLVTSDGPVDLYLDWRVIDIFTHGDVDPDDAFGSLVHKFLTTYVESVDLFNALPDEMRQAPLVPNDRYSTPVDEQVHGKFLKAHHDSLWLANRLKGAMQALGFSKGMMRRMVAPSRTIPMIVALGINSIPDDEAWISTKTMHAMKVHQHIRVRGTDALTHRDHLITRFPTANFGRVRIMIDDRIPDGIMMTSTIVLQVGTEGDADGDMYPFVAADEVPALVDRSRKDKELVARFFRMLGYNGSVSVQQPVDVTPEPVTDAFWPEEAQKAGKSRTMSDYLLFSSLENSALADWLKPAKTWKPEDGSVSGFDIGTYSDWGEQVSRFNVAGLGYAFFEEHVCTIMKAIFYRKDWGLYQLWDFAEKSAACVYENAYLPGGPKPEQWTWHQLFEDPDPKKLGEWRDALVALGFDKARDKHAFEGRDDTQITTGMATMLYLARQLVIATQSWWSTGYIRKAQKDAIGDYVKYVPLIGLMRCMFAYQLKLSWMKKMPTIEQIRECVSVIPETSPLWDYFEFALRYLYPYVLEVARNATLKAYEAQLGI